MPLDVRWDVFVVRMRTRKDWIAWMGLGIVPVEALPTSIYSIAVALNDVACEVQILPDCQRDTAIELNDAVDFSEGWPMLPLRRGILLKLC